MKLNQPKPYWFTEEQIAILAEKYNGIYIGQWCIKTLLGEWTEVPLDVFYSATPDRSKGHSSYFGFYRSGDNVMIADASSAFSKMPILGIEEDGIVYVSRFRHDSACTPSGKFIDGGRDYIHSNFVGNFTKVSIYDNEFIFE